MLLSADRTRVRSLAFYGEERRVTVVGNVSSDPGQQTRAGTP